MRVALRLITKADLDHESIEKIKEWRIKNNFSYLGDYKITHSSIKKWLIEYILDKDDRILYWVVADGEYIGHIGLNHITKHSVELSDVSRGIDKYKGAMHEALDLLISPYKHVYLRVLPDNHHAIEFYKKNGFVLKGRMGEFLKYERINK